MFASADSSALLLFLALIAGPPPPAQDTALLRDLTYTVTMQGLRCGQVVSARQQAEGDYIALCRDGNHYRVSAPGQGAMFAQKP